MKVILRDSKPDKGQPSEVEMHAVDADHALGADPERYSVVERRPVTTNRSLEDRVGFLEDRLARIEVQMGSKKNLTAPVSPAAKMKMKHDE